MARSRRSIFAAVGRRLRVPSIFVLALATDNAGARLVEEELLLLTLLCVEEDALDRFAMAESG